MYKAQRKMHMNIFWQPKINNNPCCNNTTIEIDLNDQGIKKAETKVIISAIQ